MKRLFHALAKTSEGAFVINDRNQIVFWNQAAEAILGYTAAEATGVLCYQMLGGRDEEGRDLCQRYCRIAIGVAQGETVPNLNVFARTRNGESRWLNVTTFAYPTGDPELGDVIVHLFRDATQQKSNERFIAQVLAASRELRTDTERPGRTAPSGRPASSDPYLEALTPREQEVLRLLAHGLSTEEMADMLSISLATTRNHIQSVLSKLKVHSRLEAVAYVYQQGLIEGSSPPNATLDSRSGEKNSANDLEK